MKTEVVDLSNLKTLAPDIEKLTKLVDHILFEKEVKALARKKEEDKVKKPSKSIKIIIPSVAFCKNWKWCWIAI